MSVIKKIAVILVVLSAAGCGKMDNRVWDYYYNDSDFAVQCLYGYKYLARVTGGEYLTPKFDIETGLPERCGSL